jgi:NTP pyrophosphatase (non-canonical NTP hydrolase)
MPTCKDCGHPDTSHNDAGCFHADNIRPCFCRTSGESIRFPEQYHFPAEHEGKTKERQELLLSFLKYSIPSSVLDLIQAERQRQDEKWGEQNHPDEIWLAILSEEIGEASQALLHNKFGGKAKGTLRDELVQVAAVAVQWLECIERNGEIIEIVEGAE